MHLNWKNSLWMLALTAAVPACTPLPCPPAGSASPDLTALSNALQTVVRRYAPDPHLAVVRLGAAVTAHGVALTGYVASAAVKAAALNAVRAAGLAVEDSVAVLPEPALGARTWGLVCLSVANGRERPHNSAEMATQELMGHAVRVWKRCALWSLVQTADRYVCWMEKGSFHPCTAAEVEAWRRSPRLIVTTFEDCVREAPRPDAQPVTDVVWGCVVKQTGAAGEWFQVELPDGRAGWLPRRAAEDYATWKQSRRATPQSIEHTARQLLGRPYLWGGNSPRGLDCSGFNKFVFFLNGIDLDRNASQQARQGVEVPLDAHLSQLRKGDLVFFGSRARRGRPERITHTGIYLGGKLFIHASARVRISSLDPGSPLRDEARIRTLLRARRVLPDA